MAKYYWDGKDWVEKKPVRRASGPYIWNDLPPYMSPLGTGMIDGRRARREDMARGGSREVDPSERLDLPPKTEADAARERAERASWQHSFDPAVAERLKKGR